MKIKKLCVLFLYVLNIIRRKTEEEEVVLFSLFYYYLIRFKRYLSSNITFNTHTQKQQKHNYFKTINSYCLYTYIYYTITLKKLKMRVKFSSIVKNKKKSNKL